MGKSRSATIVCAYLMHRFRISPTEALEQLRRGRGVCDPNDGFWKQLELYYSMDMADDVEGNPIYQRWLYEGELRSSRRLGQAPEADKIRFEDEHAAAVAGSHERELKCRRCRLVGRAVALAWTRAWTESNLGHADAPCVPRSTSSGMTPSKSPTTTPPPRSPRRPAPTFSSSRSRGCGRSWSRASSKVGWNVQSAKPMSASTHGRGCSAAVETGSFRPSVSPRLASTRICPGPRTVWHAAWQVSGFVTLQVANLAVRICEGAP